MACGRVFIYLSNMILFYLGETTPWECHLCASQVFFLCLIVMMFTIRALIGHKDQVFLHQNSCSWSELWCVSILSSFPSEKDLNYYFLLILVFAKIL